MESSTSATEPRTQWRRLDEHLWAGRRDGAPIGLVERGRRFTATDAGDRVLGAFRTLEDAQRAIEAGDDRPQRRRPAVAPWVVTGVSLLVAGAGGALLLLGR